MNYFIDCGTSLFEGLNYFNSRYNFDNTWQIDSFEVNPLTYQAALSVKPSYPNLNFHNKAVWINDGTIEVNINEDLPLDNGTNILSNPPDRDIQWNRKFNWSKKLPVQAIDLARIVAESTHDKIIIKMDIEGAEFEVLNHLLAQNCVEKISCMYIEFHERFFIDEVQRYSNLKYQLIQELRNRGVEIIEWE